MQALILLLSIIWKHEHLELKLKKFLKKQLEILKYWRYREINMIFGISLVDLVGIDAHIVIFNMKIFGHLLSQLSRVLH